MSRKYKIQDQDKLYFITYAVVNWIDTFTRDEYRKIVLDSLSYCSKNKGLEIYAWCIMTNHVHLIIGTHGNKMEDIMRDHKTHTSQQLLKAISHNPLESRKEWMLEQFAAAGQSNSNNTYYQFWQQHNKPIELFSKEMIDKYLSYIHNNPVTAGFVDKPEDWLNSSARDYNGQTGLLDCLLLADTALYGD